MFTTAAYFLCLYILMLLLAIVSVVGNGFILIVILTSSSLRKNTGLYLLTSLSMADFFLAFLLVPYIVLMIAGWDAVLVDYPAAKMILWASPVVAEIKINSFLTIAIAWDRFSAMQWPVAYKLKNRGFYAIKALIIGLAWATFDLIYDFNTAAFQPVPGCRAGGCFLNATFRNYWSVSDMFVNIFAMASTALVLFKLSHFQATQGRQGHAAHTASELASFQQANRIVVYILLCSGVCIFLPSVFAGLGEMLGLAAFKSAGPFVAVGLLACGVANSFIYGIKHKDIRKVISKIMKNFVKRKTTRIGESHQ